MTNYKLAFVLAAACKTARDAARQAMAACGCQL